MSRTVLPSPPAAHAFGRRTTSAVSNHGRSAATPAKTTGSQQDLTSQRRLQAVDKQRADRSIWRPWLSLILMLVAGLLSYANSFQGVLVFDDEVEIGRNTAIRCLWPPQVPMFEGEGLPRRPLPYYTFALNYAISGKDLWSYHAANLTIHLANAFLLWALIRRTLRMPRVPGRWGAAADGLALATALLWLVHPLQTQAVTYIYQRMESLMALFYLLTLYCFVRSVDSPRPSRWLAIAVLCCAAGMGCKEVMVTAPLLVMWYDRVFVASTWRELFSRRWRFYAALAATWPTLLAVIISQSFRYGELEEAIHTPWSYAINQSSVILHYLRLAIFPRGQCMYYLWPEATFSQLLLPLIAIGLLGLATVWSVVCRPALGFIAGSFFVILAPTSSLMPVHELAFEHRMYLSLAPVILLAVLAGYAAIGRWRRLTRFQRAAVQGVSVVCLAVALSLTTYARNGLYANYIDIWRDTVTKAPQNWEGHYSLGTGLLKAHRYQEAIPEFERAITIVESLPAVNNRWRWAESHSNLGVSLVCVGRQSEALAHYERAIEIQPNCTAAYLNLGNLLRDSAPEKAQRCIEKAIELEPQNPKGYNNLAAILLDTDPQRAYGCCLKSLELEPRNPAAHTNLGIFHAKRGDVSSAVAQFNAALDIDPDFTDARRNLALLLRRLQPRTRGER